MRWRIHFVTITFCLVMASAATFAQQPQGSPRSQGNRNGGPVRRVSVEHDVLSNADYTTSMNADGDALFTVRAGDFLLEKALDSSGTFTLRLTQGRDVVSIVRDPAGYLVGRGRRSARIDPRSTNQEEARDSVRSLLLGSPAVRSFRRLSVILENRDEREEESPVMLSALLDGGLVQMLDGDVGAVSRVAKRAVRRQRGRMQAVALKRLPGDLFKDCVGLYEMSLLDAWNQYSQCLEWANSVRWWVQGWAENSCTWEWIARSQQYLWQFTACFALPI